MNKANLDLIKFNCDKYSDILTKLIETNSYSINKLNYFCYSYTIDNISKFTNMTVALPKENVIIAIIDNSLSSKFQDLIMKFISRNIGENSFVNKIFNTYNIDDSKLDNLRFHFPSSIAELEFLENKYYLNKFIQN